MPIGVKNEQITRPVEPFHIPCSSKFKYGHYTTVLLGYLKIPVYGQKD